MKLILEYSKFGNALSDFDVEREYAFLLQKYRQAAPDAEPTWRYHSTSPIFSRVRLGIVEGDINHEDVLFLFETHKIHPNRFGAIHDWPDGFCDVGINLSEKILIEMVKKGEAERDEKSR